MLLSLVCCPAFQAVTHTNITLMMASPNNQHTITDAAAATFGFPPAAIR